MRRLFSMLLLLVVITVGVGFMRGWFQVSANKELLGEKLDVHIQVDRDKMLRDANTVKDNTKALLNQDK